MTKFEFIEWLNNCQVEWWVDEEHTHSLKTKEGDERLMLHVCFSVPDEEEE